MTSNGKGNGHANGAGHWEGNVHQGHLFDGWQKDLIVTEKGNPKPSIANVMHAMRACPYFQNTLQFDRFALRTAVVKHLPWDDTDAEHRVRFWNDNDDHCAVEWMHRNGIFAKIHEMGLAALRVSRENPYHPLHDFLDKCRLLWDADDRLDSVPELFGVEVNRYTSSVFRAMMISAVARALKPGCKVDSMLVLEGGQGAGKSSAIRALFGDTWFSDNLADMGSKDSVQQLHGKWCVEVAELVAMLGGIDKIKAFITCQSDFVRLPYERAPADYPRASIFIGTTNLSDWNRDFTGGRRYWPVKVVNAIKLDQLKFLREQLWGEAVHRFLGKEEWWLQDQEVVAVAKEEQEARHVGDPWTKTVLDAVLLKQEVTGEELLAGVLQLDASKQDEKALARVGRILRKAKWKSSRPRTSAGRVTVYHRPIAGQEEMPF
jgi:predicted P-loop ATPase